MDEQMFMTKSGVVGPVCKLMKLFLWWTKNCVGWRLVPWLMNFVTLDALLSTQLSRKNLDTANCVQDFKKWLGGQHFENDKELKNAVENWFNSQAASFYADWVKEADEAVRKMLRSKRRLCGKVKLISRKLNVLKNLFHLIIIFL
eukprot:XP_016656911.1 PREDICTED: uncharacterized protein LOC107882693 [Acyrthosiphon pisum]